MTPPKRHSSSQGFTDHQKAELVSIIDEALKRSMAPAIRAELKDAGLRLDGDVNQMAAGADFTFLRKMRVIFESASSKIGGAIVLAIVMGVASLFVYGAKAFLGK